MTFETPAAMRGAEVHLGVRPEDLRLADGGEALLEGRVTLVEPLGEVTLVYVDIGGGAEPVVAKLPGAVRLERGTTVCLAADPAALRLFGPEGEAVRAERRVAAA